MMRRRFDHLSDRELLIGVFERIETVERDIREIKNYNTESDKMKLNHESRISKMEGKIKVILMLLGGIIGGGGLVGLLIKLAGG